VSQTISIQSTVYLIYPSIIIVELDIASQHNQASHFDINTFNLHKTESVAGINLRKCAEHCCVWSLRLMLNAVDTPSVSPDDDNNNNNSKTDSLSYYESSLRVTELKEIYCKLTGKSCSEVRSGTVS